MLEDIDLTRELSRDEYKARKDELDLRLAALQREAKERGVPIVIVFEGWDAAGKGTLINELILPLDPRGFRVHCTHEPNEEQTLRPFLWRFWIETPVATPSFESAAGVVVESKRVTRELPGQGSPSSPRLVTAAVSRLSPASASSITTPRVARSVAPPLLPRLEFITS